MSTMHAQIVAVHRSAAHEFSKTTEPSIRLIEGLGVEGDAHAGVKVQHLSRVKRNPDQPNLRQVHLMAAELFDELIGKGHVVNPGDMGENITTRGIDLLALPTDAELRLGATARVRITGLRNPCVQIDRFDKGLMHAVLDHAADGSLIRKAGVMGVVLAGGELRPGDAIRIHLPTEPHQPLQPV